MKNRGAGVDGMRLCYSEDEVVEAVENSNMECTEEVGLIPMWIIPGISETLDDKVSDC